MRRILLCIVAVAFGLAFVGTMFWATHRSTDTDGAPARPFAPDGFISYEPIESLVPPDTGPLQSIDSMIDDWNYPNAESLDTSTLIKETATYADGTVSRTELGTRRFLFTPDDFPKVVDHYIAKMTALLPIDESIVGEHTAANGVVLMIDDAEPSHDRDPRALDLATLSLQAANCSINVTISRGPEEDATYVQVIYNEWPIDVHE